MDNVSLSRAGLASPSPKIQDIVAQDEPGDQPVSDFDDVFNEEVQLGKSQQEPDKSSTEAETQSLDDDISEAGVNDESEPETSQQADDTNGLVIEASAMAEGQEEGKELPVAAITGQLMSEPVKAKDGSDKQKNNRATQLAFVTGINTSTGQQVAPLSVGQVAASQLQPENVDASEINMEEKLLLDGFKSQLTKESLPTEKIMAAKLAASSAIQQIALASQQQQVPATTMSASLNAVSGHIMSDSLTNPMPSLQTSILTPLQSPAWSQGVMDKLNLMVNGQFQKADIKLNPANLGSIEIKLSIKDDQASVSFISQHLPVREALDQAIPRLREMLEQQGLNLVNVDVSSYSDQQQSNSEFSDDDKMSAQYGTEQEVEAAIEKSPENMQTLSISGLSLYA